MADGQRRRTKRTKLAVLAGIAGSQLVPLPAQASVACGQVIRASVTLSADLHCPGRDALFVDASHVTLNLGGRTVSGSMGPEGTFGFTGVTITSGHTNVSVRNGTIRGFDRGLAVHPLANDALVTGLTLDANETGLITIVDFGTGRPTERSHIINNTITNTTRFSGIQLQGDHHRVERNTIEGNAGIGISITGSANLVQANTIRDAGGNAVRIGTSPGAQGPLQGNRVVGNRIEKTGQAVSSSAISVTHAASTIVETNVIEGGRFPGVFVSRSSDTEVSGNQVRGHDIGVLVRVGSNTKVERNIVTENAVGIHVSTFEGDPTGTVLTGNVARQNGLDGIAVQAPSTQIQRNTSYGNGRWGIWAASGATDGGGNRAWGNGVVQQCTANITC